jgi:hypothetical protein
VRELFGVEAAELSEGLRGDPRPRGFAFDNYAAVLAVDDALWRGYQAAAAEVARLATADAARVAALVGSDAAEPRDAPATSMPSIFSAPALGGSISVTSRASVLLPQPDSPTTASVRPACSSNEAPRSACSVALPLNIPRRTT